MELSLFFIIILAHVLFDFVFQGNGIMNSRFPEKPVKSKECSKKNKEKYTCRKRVVSTFSFKKSNKILIYKTIQGNIVHTLIHFGGIYFVAVLVGTIKGQAIDIPFNVVILVSILHFIIDECKSILYLINESVSSNIWFFIIDQLAHLVAIISIFEFTNNMDVISIFRNKLMIYPNGFSLTERLLIIGILIFSATWMIGVFIKILLCHLNSHNALVQVGAEKDKRGDGGAPNGGFIIGVLERVFILVSIIMNYPMMIGFVLTVKSVARFKKLDNNSFAEYFIIGTFLSFIPSIVIGRIISKIIVI